MVKSLICLIIGVAIGWIAHATYQNKTTAAPATITVTAPCAANIVTQPVIETTPGCTILNIPSHAAPPVVEEQKTPEPSDPTTNMNTQLIAAYEKQDWQTIVNLATQADDWPSQSEHANLMLGHAQLALHQYQIGLQSLNNAYEIKPNNEMTDNIEAIINTTLAALDNIEKIDFLQWLTTYQSSQLAYWYQLAELLTEESRFNDAEAALTTISSSPEYQQAASKLQQHITRLRAMSKQRRVDVDLIPYGDHYLVKATINDEIEVTLLLDTGASISTLSPASLEKLNIQLANAPTMVLNTANGMVSAKQFVMSKMRIGESELPNMPAGVIDLGASHFDGLLGMNYLNYFDFYIDQQRNKLHLSPK